jgi:RNA polymerase sigma-70 factor (ECF subfamily)
MPKSRRLSDATLVRRSQQGDRRAFSALLGRYDRRLRGLAHALLLDRGQVDAALGLAYLRAWRDVVRVSSRDDVAAWLYRNTYNACVDQLRRGEPRTDGVGSDPVAAALASLAPADRVAVVLVDREGFSPVSAARILGLDEAALISRLGVAREHLVTELGIPMVAPGPTAEPAVTPEPAGDPEPAGHHEPAGGLAGGPRPGDPDPGAASPGEASPLAATAAVGEGEAGQPDAPDTPAEVEVRGNGNSATSDGGKKVAAGSDGGKKVAAGSDDGASAGEDGVAAGSPTPASAASGTDPDAADPDAADPDAADPEAVEVGSSDAASGRGDGEVVEVESGPSAGSTESDADAEVEAEAEPVDAGGNGDGTARGSGNGSGNGHQPNRGRGRRARRRARYTAGRRPLDTAVDPADTTNDDAP